MKIQVNDAGLPLARQLARFGALNAADTEAVIALVGVARIRAVKARIDVIHEGDRPRSMYVILSGWACRHKTLPDGRRQTVSLLVPGDLCDLNSDLLERMDHSIGALTSLRVAEIDHARIDELCVRYPSLAVCLRKQMLASASVQREWTVNLGQRGAPERLAHLFCEIALRLRSVGPADGASFEFPLTQSDLADAVGLTSVHVNRTLQQLRATGHVSLGGRVLTIPSFARLADLAQFTPDYLHLGEGYGGRSTDRRQSAMIV